VIGLFVIHIACSQINLNMGVTWADFLLNMSLLLYSLTTIMCNYSFYVTYKYQKSSMFCNRLALIEGVGRSYLVDVGDITSPY